MKEHTFLVGSDRSAVAAAFSSADVDTLVAAVHAGAAITNTTENLPIESITALISRENAPLRRRTCRIDFDGATYWSPCYVASDVTVEHRIEVLGRPLGSVLIGYPNLTEPLEETAPERQWAEILATIVAQALALWITAREANQREARLEQDRDNTARTERLLGIGSWEFDPATCSFTWSSEAKRVLGVREHSAMRRPQRNPLFSQLQGMIQTASGSARFTYEFDFVSGEGVAGTFEAFGEVRAPGEGTSFGFVRALNKQVLKSPESRDIDPLTELPNRRALSERLQVILLKPATSGALVLLDVDRFGEVNQTRGQDFGDAFLRAFARRLREAVPHDFVARIGDNEFAVLLESMPEAQAANRACAFLAGMRPLSVFGQETVVTLSLGVATFPADGSDTTELTRNASLALNAAKDKGPNSYVRFAPALRDAAIHRVSLRSEVRSGLALGQFVPFYQPKIDLQTGEISGFEVLGRWHQPSGLRQPSYFIPALDEAEISREYYVRLLEKVLTDLLRWRSKQIECGRLAINTSRSEYLDFDLAAYTLGRLEKTGLPTSLLGIEITESVLLSEDDGAAKRTLIRLQEAGIQIALDDFGTGYASLTHLKSYPIDVIKIDRSFVASLEDDAGNRAIVTAVTSLGRTLGLIVVAEGVETRAQGEILRACACSEIQGYFCGHPMPASDVPDFIASWQPETIRSLETAALTSQ